MPALFRLVLSRAGARKRRAGRRGEHVHAAARVDTNKDGATCSRGPQHRDQVGHPRLERGKLDVPARDTDATVIVGDDAGEGRQFSEPRSGERVLPFHIDIAWPHDGSRQKASARAESDC
jgi:hypothetical protein